MLRAIKSRFRDDVPLTYGTILALDGIAKGMWQGAYAWFLSSQLGFSPAEIGLIIGAQFVLQIILEVPSGTWADRGNTRVIIAASYAAYLGYCAIYLVCSLTLQPGSSSALPWALGAEALFGIGAALFSGTLDAWIAEKQRAASTDSSDFEQRLRKIHSISALWGKAPTAIVGAIAFGVATKTSAAWPWALGGALYLVAGLLALVAIPARTTAATSASDSISAAVTPTASISMRIKALLEDTGRHTGRALSFLQEKPATLKLFLRASLAFMPFYATQVFWIPFLAQTLFVTHTDHVSSTSWGVLAGVPLVAALWGAGELARALGGSWGSNRLKTEIRRNTRIGIAMLGYFAGVMLQLASVLTDWHEVKLFALGYLFARLCEGRARRDIGVVTDQAIVSDRATLRSLDALIRSIIGLVYITLVGSLMQSDPVIAYGAISLTALLVGIVFPLLDRKKIRTDPDRSTELIRTPGGPVNWDPDKVGYRLRDWITFESLSYAVFLLVLIVVMVFSSGSSRPFWAQLNHWSAEGVVAEMHERETYTDESKQQLTTWRISADPTATPVGCRVPVREPMHLWNNDLIGDHVRARVRRIGGTYYLEILIPSNGTVIAKLNTNDSKATQCFKLVDTAAFVFNDRQVIPVVIHRTSQPGTSSSLLYAELVVAFFVIFFLIAMAGADVRRRLQYVMQAVPGTVLDQARVQSGKTADQIYRPTDGLPRKSFPPFDLFRRDLDATCIIIGGFSYDQANESRGVWVHQYGLTAIQEDGSEQVLAEWIAKAHPTFEGADEFARKLGTQFAAASIVSRSHSDRGGNADRIAGFALAVYGHDEAARYVSPVERKVLQLLAEVARMQLERSRRNVDTDDTLHLLKTVLDQIRTPLRRFVRTAAQSPGLLVGASAACISRADYGHIRLAQRLGMKVDLDATPRLHEGLSSFCTLFTHSRHGDMTMTVEMDPALDGQTKQTNWYIVEGAVFELLSNAAKYGCTREQPDVNVVLRVEQHGAQLKFVVKNDRPWPADTKMVPGVGFKTLPERLREVNAVLIPLHDEAGWTVVGFTLPRKVVITDAAR